MARHQKSIYLDDDVLKILKNESDKNGTSRSQIINNAVRFTFNWRNNIKDAFDAAFLEHEERSSELITKHLREDMVKTLNDRHEEQNNILKDNNNISRQILEKV